MIVSDPVGIHPRGAVSPGGVVGKVTLQDIADAVGVSRMTVSNAFNRPHKLSESLRVTILQTANQLGYGGPDPSARALARGRSGTVGLLLTDTLGEAFRDPVSTEFLVAVGDALAERSLALTLVATAGDNPPLGQDLPMDGAIVFVCDPRVDLDWLRHRGTPVVTVDQAPTRGVPAVNVDDAGGSRAAAQHLLDLGHRSIGILTVSSDLDGRIRPAAQRLLGWHQALDPAGVVPVFGYATPRPVTAAYDAALTLLNRPDRPTAAALLLRRLRRASRPRRRGPRPERPGGPVGDRLRRRRLRLHFRPALTTVRQQVGEKGRAAVTALLALLDGTKPKARTLLSTELVVRGSTAAAPARSTPPA